MLDGALVVVVGGGDVPDAESAGDIVGDDGHGFGGVERALYSVERERRVAHALHQELDRVRRDDIVSGGVLDVVYREVDGLV